MKKQLLVKNDNFKIWLLNEQTLQDDMWNHISSFEKTFIYPLGKEKFKIQHGRDGHYSDFFKSLSHTFSTLVVEKNNIISGVITVKHFKNINYICDYKMKFDVDFQERILLMNYCFDMLKKQYNDKIYFINMSKTEKNPMMKFISYFFNCDVYTKEYYLHQKTKKDFSTECRFSSNIGKKDIIINDNVVPLYHLHKHGDISWNELPYNAVIMFLNEETSNTPLTLGTNCNIQDINIFSYYI